MKIFLDTNILLEYFRNRGQAETVENILNFIHSNGHQGCFSVGSFYTLIYILDTELKKEDFHNPERLVKLRYILKGILSEYSVSYEADLNAAVEDERFTDLEDSCQYRSALSAGCDVLLTLNDKDFKKADQKDMMILTPVQFASLFF